MNSVVDAFWSKLISKIDKRFYLILINCFIFGIISHGARIFDYIYMHDGIWGLYSSGATTGLGRWSLGITNRIIKFIMDGHNYQSPVLLGFLTILFITVFIYIIVILLDINSKILISVLSGIAISFPFFPSLFNFMFTAPFYTFAMALSVFSVYLFAKFNNKYYMILICCLLFSYSIGIYQAVLPVGITFLLFYTIKLICENKVDNKFVIKEILFIILTVVIYIVLAKILAKVNKTGLWQMRGMNNFGMDSIDSYFKRFCKCYVSFFVPAINKKALGIFLNGKLIFVYYLSLVLLAFMFKKNYYDKVLSHKDNKLYNIVLLSLCIIAIPFALNFIYFMIRLEEGIYVFMLMSLIFYIVLFIWNVDMLNDLKYKYLYFITYSILVFTLYTYCRFDNASHLANNLRYNRLKSYYTVMISQIKNTPGYKDEMPICYINKEDIKDSTYHDPGALQDLIIDGSTSGLYTYMIDQFLDIYLGFGPPKVPEDEFKDRKEVIDMPHYPDYGSMKVIDDVLVIKY